MNDEFLYQFRKQPRRAFAEMLFERINPEKNMTSQKSLVRKMAWGLGILFITFSIMLVVSPTVRAQIEKVIKQIGGMTFYEVELLPTVPADYDVIVTPVIGHTVVLAELRDEIPFDIAIPAWVPEGFEFVSANVYSSVSPNNDAANGPIIMFWQKNIQGIATMLHLFVTYIGPQESDEIGLAMLVGPGSVEEVAVNGKPAALIRGGSWASFDCYLCDPSHSKPTATPQWSDDSSLTLMWIDDGVIYELLADDAYYVSVEDLIRMAESMR